jgi:hypothetical protein
VAFRTVQELEKKMGPVFADHVAGGGQINSFLKGL